MTVNNAPSFKGELNPENNMAENWSIYLINLGGVNESGERFHIKEIFRDKMCKTTVAPSDGLMTTLNNVVYIVIYVIAYQIGLVKFRSNI